LVIELAFAFRCSVLTLAAVLFVISAQAAEDIVWQLRLSDGQAIDCALEFTRFAKGDKGQPFLEADSRGDKSEWHSCIIPPRGLIKAGKDYVIALDYEIIERSDLDSYFYVFGRSGRLGTGADQWQRWHGESGAQGVAKLRISRPQMIS
jgi:hypothetical protein